MVAGIGITAVGFGGEAAGLTLSATGVGALGGVPLTVASAGVAAAAAGGIVFGNSASNFGQDASDLFVESRGNYSNIPDSPSVGPGKKFTTTQKQKIIDENKNRNGGNVKSDLSGEDLLKPEQSKSGVKPDPNEWQIDHIDPRSKNGSNSNSNAQVLSRKENRTKSDN